MYKDEEKIVILDKPLEDATILDYCKGTSRQRQLKTLREMPLEEMKEQLNDDELAEMIFNAVNNCKEGYMRIQRQSPSPDKENEGWTYIFAEGLPLHLDRPDTWYSTSNILKIDWEGKTFTTLNSVYSFSFVDEKEIPPYEPITETFPDAK